MTDEPLLLVFNIGSSSVKFRLFALTDDLPLVAGGKVTDIGTSPAFSARRGDDAGAPEDMPADTTHETGIRRILDWLDANNLGAGRIAAAAHRIVHGGGRFADPVRMDNAVLEYLRAFIPLAPLHQPHNLAGYEILRNLRPAMDQFACFDTAFHERHDRLFYEFALPENIRARGVRRHGFHGLSYDWVVHWLRRNQPHLARGRVVVAHLGNGASLCAIKNGQSIDTTMGMTALDGLPMGTRCGSIDPGALVYMTRELGLGVDEVERILYGESGLKGLSGITNDVRTLMLSHDPRAAFALDYFVMKTAQHIASMAVAAGGMEALVFTGGIGENAPQIRDRIREKLAFLPKFDVHVVAADEERSMAMSVWEHFALDLTGA